MNKKLLITAAIGLLAGLGQVKTQADEVFTSGPISGIISGQGFGNPSLVPGYAWVDTASFTVSEDVDLTKVELGLWTYPSFPPLSLNWSIGTSAFGSDLSSGANASLTDTFLFNNHIATGLYNYDIYDSTFSVTSPVLVTGTTYWLTMSDAVSSPNGIVYWDENNVYTSGQTWEHENPGGPTYTYDDGSTWDTSVPSLLPPEAFTLYGTQGVPNNNPNFVPDAASTCLLLGLGLAALALASRKLVAAAA
jgi:hypothetical protein